MLKTLAVIAAVVAVIVAGILIYAATRPDSFIVKRSAAIKAPPERLFALINDLHGWAAWSPYEKKDPDMKRTFAGAAQGKGAVYEWGATRTSAPAAWRSSRRRHRRRSRSSSIS